MNHSATAQMVREELQRIEEDCTHTGKSHFEAAARWGSYHYWLGVPAMIIGGAAGAAFFQKYPNIAGGMALIAAGLTSLQTLLRPADKAAEHKTAGDGFLALKNDARVYRTVRLLDAPDDDSVSALDELNQRRNELNRTSPQFWRMDRKKALNSISSGEANYGVDRGE